MAWVYDEKGLMEDYECRHGYPSAACGVISDFPTMPDMCAQVGEEMRRWYYTLPAQSKVRVGKIGYMEAGEIYSGGTEPHRANLDRLSRE